jgi:hypothetical protein
MSSDLPSRASRLLESCARRSQFHRQRERIALDLLPALALQRGYPMSDFERRAADISVDHPAVIENYRAAQAIAARDERGEANTEELRQAVVHYRVLFGEMLEVREAEQEVPELAPLRPGIT